MNYRIYKNEYSETFIQYLKSSKRTHDVYEIESESDAVLEIAGISEEECDNIASVMFKSDDEIVASGLFPDFHTIDDEIRELSASAVAAHDMIQNALCKILTSDAYKANQLGSVSPGLDVSAVALMCRLTQLEVDMRVIRNICNEIRK